MIGMRKTLTGGLIAAAALLTGLPGAQAQSEIVIGAVVPSSGPFAEWGRTNTVTLKMLEKQINASLAVHTGPGLIGIAMLTDVEA